jgi:hypothetical protein
MSSSSNVANPKNIYISKMLEGGGFSALTNYEKEQARNLLSPDEFERYALGRNPSGSTSGSAGSNTGTTSGGNLNAEDLLKMYQDNLSGSGGSGGSGNLSADDQLRLMRESNALDLQRKTAEQNLQMEGQREALAQSREARAAERKTEFDLEARRQGREQRNAMAAYKGL